MNVGRQLPGIVFLFPEENIQGFDYHIGNSGIVFGSISIDTFGQPAGDLNGEFLGGVGALNFEPLTVHNLLNPFVAVKQSETSNTLPQRIFQPKD
jgi:hypothetical protein